MPKTLAELTPQEAAVLLCYASFPDFLLRCSVRSDDPLNPSVAKWQPWPALNERAECWQRGESEFILKARQLGFTWLVAAYCAWRARQGWAIGLVSKGQDEARGLLARIHYIEATLPKYLQCGAQFRADSADYPNGGSIKAFPSTPDAGISWTFQLVVFDEFAFHPYGAANYAAIRPTVSAGAQMIILSTADPALGPSGAFHDLYWASKRGETPYKAVFVPWSARPSRDEAWLERERRAYIGHPEEFDAYYPETDAAAFVARSGLVYPQFKEERHVRPERIPLNLCARAVAGVDWGGGDPTAITVMGLEPRQHVHQYAEFARRGTVGVDEIAGFIGQFPVRQVRCGADEPVAIATLQQALGPTYDVQAADTRRAEGLGLVAFLLDNDRLTIEPSNKQSIAEFPGYRWAERTDPNDKTRYATKTPVDHHADLMDARRYACAELLAMLMPSTALPKLTLAGRPMRRSAV